MKKDFFYYICRYITKSNITNQRAETQTDSYKHEYLVDARSTTRNYSVRYRLCYRWDQ